MAAKRKTKAEKEEVKKVLHCINCENAYLMQRDNNPIVSTCKHRGKDRNVARLFPCPIPKMFKQLQGEPVIHEMIKYTE